MRTKIITLFIFTAVLLISSCTKEDEDPVAGNPDKVSYTADIKPLLTNSCKPCHVTGGPNPKWDDYATAKSHITEILERVQKETTAAGFMPQGGTKLSSEKIALLKKWVTDGLLEN